MKLDGPSIAPLTGLAVGNSLGVPFNTTNALHSDLQAWNGWFERKGSHQNLTTRNVALVRALSNTFVDHKTYAPASVVKAYLAAVPKSMEGLSKTTTQALTRLTMGLPWTQSGMASSEESDAALRAVPIGVHFWRNHQAAEEMARIDTQLTHKSEMAEQGSAIVALGIALLIEGKWDRIDIASKVAEWLPNGPMKSRLIEARNRGRRVMGVTGRQAIDAFVDLGTGAHAIQAIPAAFGIFTASKNFKDAVEIAVRCGGATPIVASIVGALAGTHFGIKEVARYMDPLERSPSLRSLEKDLLASASPSIQPFPQDF